MEEGNPLCRCGCGQNVCAADRRIQVLFWCVAKFWGLYRWYRIEPSPLRLWRCYAKRTSTTEGILRSLLRGIRQAMYKDENMAVERGWYVWAWSTGDDIAEDSTNLVSRHILPLERGDGGSAAWHFGVLLLLLRKLAVIQSQLYCIDGDSR